MVPDNDGYSATCTAIDTVNDPLNTCKHTDDDNIIDIGDLDNDDGLLNYTVRDSDCDGNIDSTELDSD